MFFGNKDRCQKCKNNKQSRFCLRTDKRLCWVCCNDLRLDKKCPKECKYTPENDAQLHIKANCESYTEYVYLMKALGERWLYLAQPELNGLTPLEAANNSDLKPQLHNLLAAYTAIPQIYKYLCQKLQLDSKTLLSNDENHYEFVISNYLNRLISAEWKDASQFWTSAFTEERDIDTRTRHLKTTELAKITDFMIIASGLGQDKSTAFVFLDLNYKKELCILLKKEKDEWKIDKHVFTSPVMLNSDTEAVRQLGYYLTANQLGNAQDLVNKLKETFPESPDILYNIGLFYSLKSEKAKAQECFLMAGLYDKDFWEAKENYALILLSENEKEKASEVYEDIIARNPGRINALNNLGTIYIALKRFDAAEELFRKCLILEPNHNLAKANLEKLAIEKEKN